MQIEKLLIKMIAYLFEVYPCKFRISTIYSFPIIHPRSSQLFLQRSLLFNIIVFYASKQTFTAKKFK